MKAKILSILEVSLVFIILSILFRLVNATPLALKISSSFDGLLFPGYATILIASILLYIFRTQRHLHQPLSLKLNHQVDIIASGFFPFFVLSVLLSRIDWKDWTGAILISMIEIGLLYWFAWMARNKPSWKNNGDVSGILLLPLASLISSKLAGVSLAIIYSYVFVALSEEILFRGYIQSRLNSVFDRPNHLFGIRWGFGLVVSSMLFGLWHLGLKSGSLEWPHVLWTAFAGLSLGFVREKGESIIAPAILHGIINYGPQAILFYLFWSQ